MLDNDFCRHRHRTPPRSGHQLFQSWQQVISVINKQIGQLDRDRRFCAVCGNRNRDKLIKCSKCSMIYYCGPEHKQADKNIHDQYCARLYFTTLGQVACSIPALPPFPSESERWPVPAQEINSWDQWMRLHPNLTITAAETSSILVNCVLDRSDKFANLSSAIGGTNHSKSVVNNLTLALLSLVTDYLSFPISIGMTICEIFPGNRRPLNITILPSPNLHELVGCGLSHVLQAWMTELGNMFPYDQVINVIMRENEELFNKVAANCEDQLRISTIRIHRGKLSYTQDKIVDIVRPDLAVCFNPCLFVVKQTTISKGWRALLEEYVQLNVPVYLTFSASQDYERALNLFTDDCRRHSKLPTMQPYKYGRNPFGSRLTRQDPYAPNSIYARNSYHILLKRSHRSHQHCCQSAALENLTNHFDRKKSDSGNKRRSVSVPRPTRKHFPQTYSNSSSSSSDMNADDPRIQPSTLIVTSSPSKRRSLRSIKARQAAKRNENHQVLLESPTICGDQDELYRFSPEHTINFRLSVESCETTNRKPTQSLEEIRKQLELESEERRFDEDAFVPRKSSASPKYSKVKKLRQNSE